MNRGGICVQTRFVELATSLFSWFAGEIPRNQGHNTIILLCKVHSTMKSRWSLMGKKKIYCQGFITAILFSAGEFKCDTSRFFLRRHHQSLPPLSRRYQSTDVPFPHSCYYIYVLLKTISLAMIKMSFYRVHCQNDVLFHLILINYYLYLCVKQ